MADTQLQEQAGRWTLKQVQGDGERAKVHRPCATLCRHCEARAPWQSSKAGVKTGLLRVARNDGRVTEGEAVGRVFEMPGPRPY